MKNIYFVQAGYLYGVNAYIPYASGCVAAYAWNNPLIRENYRLGHFCFLRNPIEETVSAFVSPYIIAFSNYVWNYEYHKALAKAVKERYPDCLIVFGGHQVLNDSASQLDDCSYVDFLIHKAGEIPFEQLLLALLRDTNLDEVPSLSYRDAIGRLMRSKEAPSCKSCDFPSPYLTGIFDNLFEENPSLLFSMCIETNRGCPYSCAFCDWNTTRRAFYRIPMERVKAEIDWAAQHKIEFLFCVDANFGILERDEEIADYLIEKNRHTGYPFKFNVDAAKNSDEAVFRITQKLSANGLSHGATIAVQSMSPVVLNNIGRQNIDMERMRELFSLYNRANVPVYSEVILGLPGETFESFARGLGSLLTAGMHGMLEVYLCELLPNTEMSAPAYQKKHGIEGVRTQRLTYFSSKKHQDEIPEYGEFVCQTKTMPTQDWVTAFLFATIVQAFHSTGGGLRYLAVYLYMERKLPYERFYGDLMDYAQANPSTLLGDLLLDIEKRFQSFSEGDGESFLYYHPRFGEVLWPLNSALVLCVDYESERFYRELPAFLRRYDIEADLLAQLIRFQYAMVVLPGAMPPRLSFDYDFPGYFAAAFAGKEPPILLKKSTAVIFPQKTQADSWADFARDYVWYGRRKGLIRKDCEVEYDD